MTLKFLFVLPRVKKIQCRKSDVICYESKLFTCKEQNINEKVGKMAVTNQPLLVISLIHIYTLNHMVDVKIQFYIGPALTLTLVKSHV